MIHRAIRITVLLFTRIEKNLFKSEPSTSAFFLNLVSPV